MMLGLAERVLRIIRKRHADFGPTLACEKLADLHGLYLAKETVRKLMIHAGLCPPQVTATACTSATFATSLNWALIQIDGSVPRWVEERGTACTLLVKPPGAISSATVSLWHFTSRYEQV